jgi:putative selenate reductase FAD-binding subunit
MKEAVRHIVGTQFRNMATVGGSISGRFGFSDIWTLFLALDAQVELYKGGTVSLSAFGQTGPGRDIVTHIVVPKKACQTAYDSLRLNETDFPVIAVAVSADAKDVRCAIGARPARAEVVSLPISDVRSQGLEGAAKQIAHSMTYESNMRGSADYRQDMAVVLCRRLLTKVLGGDQ